MNGAGMKSNDGIRLPTAKGVRVLATDPHGLIALFKPEGMLSHPNVAKDAARSLLKARYDLKEECYEIPGGEGATGEKVWLLNRLDSATSGVLLCAVKREVAEAVRKQFAEGRVAKKYYALVFGVPLPARQVWRDRLQVSREGGRLRTSAQGGAEAETEMHLERTFPGRYPISLIELRPKTGKTHQLRVQCGKRKLPIVGDQTYGNFGWNKEFAKATGRKRLFLHSAEIGVAFSLNGARVTFSARAPLPKEFTP